MEIIEHRLYISYIYWYKTEATSHIAYGFLKELEKSISFK